VPPLVKVDEDLSEEVAEVFITAGYDAITAHAQGWAGLIDDELWPRVQAERRWLVTADKAFGDIRKFVPGTHAGILLLRADEENRRSYLQLAERAVRAVQLQDFTGALIVVTPRGIRIRD
jgi:predicted nuclease of predicted toxin-antitoxin system